MTASAEPRSKKCRAPLLPKPVADSSSFDHEPSTVAVASDPVLLRRADWGKEAATPGESSSRLRTFYGFPPAIRPRESPAAADSAAIIRPAQETSRFAGPTLRQKRCPSQHKHFATL